MTLDSANVLIYGRGTDNADYPIQTNLYGQQLMAQGLAPYVEMSRRFGHWSAMNTSALAALVVRPSTTANFTIFNPTTSLYTLVIDRIFAFNLVSTAAQARSGMWYCVHRPGLVSPTNDITARGTGVGATGTPSPAGVVGDTAMTVIDDGWFPCGNWSDVEPTGVLPGAIMEYKFEGRVLVPPGCGISSQVVSSVVGNTFTSGFAWWEVPTTKVPIGV